MYFLDTNIFLRHLTQDDSRKAADCTRLFSEIEQGRLQAWTSDLAIAELVFVLASKRQNGYNYTREQIQDGLLPLIVLDGLYLPSKDLYPRIFSLYIQHQIDFIDAYHAALIESSADPELYSYDRHFDRISTIKREEPSQT